MFRVRPGLPLFTKELLEQAARKRTYWMRVAFVGLLSYFSLTSLAYQLQTVSPLNVLGQGLPILQAMVEFEFNGIWLFLPAMACGVLTSEKERNALALLFLTRLGPWTIIIEKLLSRLFPMLMFLFCALPVMAFLYSLGGLTLFQLFVSAYFLLHAVFLTSCVAVMCSALCQTTAAAFIQTYFVLFLMGLVPGLLLSVLPENLLYQTVEGVLGWFISTSNSSPPYPGSILYSYGLQPQVFYSWLSPRQLWASLVNPWGGIVTLTPWLPAFVLGIPSFLAGLACLLVARWALYRRAFLAPSNPLLRFFKGLDRLFFWANRKVAFDVKLVRESETLPGDEPIAWREVSKRALGQFRYLVRIMIPLLFPVIFVGTMIVSSSAEFYRSNSDVGLSPLILFLWIVNLVLIAVAGANTVPLERMRQTWDVLRSMPMTGRDIISQKLRGVRRLQWVCAIPVLATIGLQTYLRYQLDAPTQSPFPQPVSPEPHSLWWEYLIGAVLCVWIYAEIVKWVALWSGLMFRNSMRAILSAVPTVLIVSCLPSLLLFLIVQYGFMTMRGNWQPDLWTPAILLVWQTCPLVFVAINEWGNLRWVSSIPLIPALINIVWLGGLLLIIRCHILKRAEWYLGRIGVPNATASERGLKSGTVNADAGSVHHAASVGEIAGAAS